MDAHMPPTTPREALHALFGERHAGHTVLHVDWRNLGAFIRCSCAKSDWYVDADRAGESGLTLVQLRHALRNAPPKLAHETRGSP